MFTISNLIFLCVWVFGLLWSFCRGKSPLCGVEKIMKNYCDLSSFVDREGAVEHLHADEAIDDEDL
jgi:hypothetical protein